MAKRRQTAKPISQKESKKQHYASCFDWNGRLQVSTRARYDVAQLQQLRQCEHFLEHLTAGADRHPEWATCRQCGLRSVMWKRRAENILSEYLQIPVTTRE